jgi:hypothetical protein
MLLTSLVLALASSGTARAETTTFSYTGSEQTFTVPAGVTTLQITATGGAGGSGGTSEAEPTPASGGLAATASDTVSVTPGATYTVEVGGAGLASGTKINGGFNGGGSSAPGFGGGGGGGGASDVCRTPLHSVIEPTACLIVAGGGGGGGGNGSIKWPAGAGGNAGQAGMHGETATSSYAGAGGEPGSVSAGGVGGSGGKDELSGAAGASGQLGIGGGQGGEGGGPGVSGGGGGGGLYGGGGGGGGGETFSPCCDRTPGGGGGGGSSYAPGGSASLSSSGSAAQVVISYTVAPSAAPSTTAPAGSSPGITTDVTSVQITASLAGQLTPSGKAAKIAALLKSGAFAVVFKALEAGSAVIDWYEVPPGAKLAKKAKPKPVLVAAGHLTFAAAGTKTIKIKLTVAGKGLLKHTKQLKLTALGTFTPTGKSPSNATRTFVLKR